MVTQYGHFNAGELSAIATAQYLKEHFGVNSQDEIIQSVKSLKPHLETNQIRSLLEYRES